MTNAIVDAITQRRTTKLYDATREISDDEIHRLVFLATRAPTAFNLQNWRFIAARTPEAKARLRKVAADQPKVTEASVTFIVCGELASADSLADRLAPSVAAGFMTPDIVTTLEGAARWLYADKPQTQRDEAIRSASLGAGFLIHAAQAHGFGSTPMIGFDAEGVSKEFGLAANEVPALLVAVGYALPENLPQKPRRPVEQVLTLF
jgi:nitroreductase